MNSVSALSSHSSSIVHVRTRRQRKGPEAALLRTMIKAEFLLGRELPAVFFHEPELPTGLPDLVAVYMCKELEVSRDRLKLKDQHIRLLHFLHTSGPTTPTEISDRLRMSPSRVRSLTAQLEAAGLLRLHADVIKPAPLSRTFAVKYIIAIEAKVHDWARALEQAAANHWFASHSYILIPVSESISRIRQRAEALGIGVLVSDGTIVRAVVRAKRRDIPSSYGSWLFNEWALRRVKPQ